MKLELLTNATVLLLTPHTKHILPCDMSHVESNSGGKRT